MKIPQHSLLPSNATAQRDIRRWLMLGVGALAAAGVFAGMLANTKSAYFYTALVAHVDLSVLVWFLSFACMLLTLGVPSAKWDNVGTAGFISVTLGSVLIGVAAFSGGIPYQNNYVPVIYHPLFFFALALIFSGILCVLVRFLLNHSTRQQVTPVSIGIYALALQLWVAVFCFTYSFFTMAPGLSRDQGYYDDLFWAGGHVLQLAYAQLIAIAWLWLAESMNAAPRWGNKPVIVGYGLSVVMALIALYLSLSYQVGTADHHRVFTLLMKHGNGLPVLVIGAGLLHVLWKKTSDDNRLAQTCLRMSFLLFGAGGILGYMITGSNVTTPAHYHGSIVGVTLALMGVAYLLLPHIGFADVSASRMARWQPVLYGGGQLCWMLGMAIGGAQGVARKVPGSADVIGGLGGFLKHGGDGLSLIGGLLFVVVVISAARSAKKPA